MGSRTATNNARRQRVYALIRKVRRGYKLTKEDKAFLMRNRRRHKCDGCGNGGHLRSLPVAVTGDGVAIRPTVKS